MARRHADRASQDQRGSSGGSDEIDSRGRRNPQRYKPGESGNPAGRPPGVPNYNKQLWDAILKFKKGDKTFLQLLLEKALRRTRLAEKLLDKITANATPEQQAQLINSIELTLADMQKQRGRSGLE